MAQVLETQNQEDLRYINHIMVSLIFQNFFELLLKLIMSHLRRNPLRFPIYNLFINLFEKIKFSIDPLNF